MMWTMLILFPQKSTLLIKKLCCMCLKTTKQWSRWSLKGEARQWDMFPEPTVALDWLFDRINLDPKIQIKYIDTKNQLADILTKANFHTWWVEHLLCLINTSHFSSTNCSEVMPRSHTVQQKLKPFLSMQRSHNEACFTNPQSCSGLVVGQINFGHQNSNPLHWHQTWTRRHVD